MKNSKWTDAQIAEVWIKRYSQKKPRIVSIDRTDEDATTAQRIDSETFWAFDALDDWVSHSPADAWRTILLILKLADGDEDVLNNLAAGPLESLLGRHSDDFIDLVEREARENPKFKDLLMSVWQNTMSDQIWERVQRASSG